MKNKPKSIKSLVLFSGGLDSLLALKILEKNNLNPVALIFDSLFFKATKAINLAKIYEFNAIVKDITAKHLKIVKTPRFGYGKNFNPCLDCHLLMLKEAKKIAKENNFRIIATGEVLGQRPFSQNKQALELIEKESGLAGKILRPLSAKSLPETKYEKQGLVNRDKLYAITGKNRKKQLELVKLFNLKEYLTPSGGCLLTDPQFSRRLKELFKINPSATAADVELLQSGRVLWLKNNLIIIGRNQKDNENLLKLFMPPKDTLMELRDFLGPVLIARNFGGQNFSNEKLNQTDLQKLAARLAWHYPKIRQRKSVVVKVQRKKGSFTLRSPIYLEN